MILHKLRGLTYVGGVCPETMEVWYKNIHMYVRVVKARGTYVW